MNKPNLASAQLQEPGTQTSIACRTDPHGLLEGWMAPARARHSKKDVEQALRFAEERGWVVRPTASGHRWGEMRCGHEGADACSVSIWSTPKSAGNHANRLRQRVRNCPHQEPPDGGGMR